MKKLHKTFSVFLMMAVLLLGVPSTFAAPTDSTPFSTRYKFYKRYGVKWEEASSEQKQYFLGVLAQERKEAKKEAREARKKARAEERARKQKEREEKTRLRAKKQQAKMEARIEKQKAKKRKQTKKDLKKRLNALEKVGK